MLGTEKKIQVLYLDHTSKWSGGEIALFRTLNAINAEAIAPFVLLPASGEFFTRLKNASIPTDILPLGSKFLEIRKDDIDESSLANTDVIASYLRYSVRVAKIARMRKTDVFHCNSLKSDIYGAIAARLARKPVLWHVRDYINPAYLPKKVARAFRQLAKKIPDGVIVNSKSTQEGLFPKGMGSQRCRVIYDGMMASELLSPLPQSFTHWRHSCPKIALLGRIVSWKGQHLFIEAAQKLAQRGIRAHFQIIGAPLFGEADYEAQIRQQAAASGAIIEFLGFRSDVPALLRALDILVHCSISPEPFGQVVVEGMAEGLPVIASDAGGVCEIIDQGVHGLRTPMGDAEALAHALEELLAHPEYASTLGQAAYMRVREKFTADQSACGVESFYREILGKK
jgi:glycosyltransferase involved in cell wall biosynthesis